MSSRNKKKGRLPAVSVELQRQAQREILSKSSNNPSLEAILNDPMHLMKEQKLDEIETKSVVDGLFPRESRDGLKIWAGDAHSDRTIYPLDQLPEELGMRYICPNPIRVSEGSQDFPRTDDNVAAVCNIIIEFDDGDLREQISRHFYLAGYRCLKALVFSGNKSLHGWYAPLGDENADIEFQRLGASLGADKAMFKRSQSTRMPNAIREDGQRQSLLYLREICQGGENQESSHD